MTDAADGTEDEENEGTAATAAAATQMLPLRVGWEGTKHLEEIVSPGKLTEGCTRSFAR